jgi:lipopolysaccharide transport system permease protein
VDAVSALNAEASPEELDDRRPGRTTSDDTPSEPWALIQIVRDLWHYRELLLQLTLRDIRLRYKQAVMGFGWAIFMPLLVVLSGLVVRLAMASYAETSLRASDVANLAVKGLAWAFVVGAVSFATSSLVANIVLVTKVYFPRVVLPLSATLAQAFDSGIGAAALAVILLFLGVPVTTALLWVPLVALLLVLFCAATGLFLSCVNLFYRDVKYIVQVALTFGIFFTPVLFEPAMFGARGARLLFLNPLTPLLEGLRLAVVSGHNLWRPIYELSTRGETVLVWTPWYLAYSAAWAVFGLILAAILFHRVEPQFAEYV